MENIGHLQDYKDLSADEYEDLLKELGIPDKRIVLKDHFEEISKKGIKIIIVAFLQELGYKKEDQKYAFRKFVRLDKQIDHSIESGFYFEWLSLILIKIEFYLRMYLYNKDCYSGKNILKDSLSFGKLIEDCRSAGMNQELIKDLRKINQARIRYIHNYLKKDFDYDSIKSEKDNFHSYVDQLVSFVNRSAFRIVLNPETLDDIIGFVRLVKFKYDNPSKD